MKTKLSLLFTLLLSFVVLDAVNTAYSQEMGIEYGERKKVLESLAKNSGEVLLASGIISYANIDFIATYGGRFGPGDLLEITAGSTKNESQWTMLVTKTNGLSYLIAYGSPFSRSNDNENIFAFDIKTGDGTGTIVTLQVLDTEGVWVIHLKDYPSGYENQEWLKGESLEIIPEGEREEMFKKMKQWGDYEI